MELAPATTLEASALAARTELGRLGLAGGVTEPRMAKIARTAIFEEALLNALHSRLNELRTAAK